MTSSTLIIRVVLAGFCALVFVGCATPEQRADRALEAGDHTRALEFYKMEIADDPRDPELYYKAAQAAIESGNLSLAERYYSRSLRYGGGTKVAKALAQFYLKTSNYASAVRVLQRLLDEVEDTQPIYNNLGTALMYSGMPLDAESYLLVAQQMEPDDPIPYLNLGLLYDEHMNNSRLALGFYECYMRLGDTMKQVRKVRVRVKELQRRWGRPPSQFDVACGKPYEPGVAAGSAESLAKLKAESDADESGGESDEKTEKDSETRPIDLGVSAGEKARPDQPPSIEKQVEDTPERRAESDARRSDETLATLERAERAFAAGEFDKVVQAFSDLPVDALNPRNTAMYGIALHEVGRNDDAEHWLEHSLERRPTVRVFETLIGIYRKTENQRELTGTCDQFRTHPNLGERADEICPASSETKKLEETIRREAR
jgi:Flp pilus assembly protein TadD